MYRRGMRVALLLSLVTVSFAFAADASKPIPADIAEAARDFRKYAKMLAEPKSIGVEFVTLCGPPAAAVKLEKEAGPHFGYYVQHYRNAVAVTSRGNGPWPVGSVFVKEKQMQKHEKPGSRELRPAGAAGMIKRAAGTRPESGDWEFFWVGDGEVKTQGMESCAGCHSGAARDYVFTKFPTAAEKLQDAGKIEPR